MVELLGAAIVDVETGRKVSLGHADGVWDVDFSPDGERVATVSEDHTARVWNARTGRPELMIRLAAVGRDVAFSPDGSMLAIAEADIDGSAIRLWNASTGQEIRTLIRPGAFSNTVASVRWPLRRRWAGGRRPPRVGVDGREVFSVAAQGGAILSLDFDPAGSRVVTASQDRLVEVWNARTGAQILTLAGHTAEAWSVAFSPDGRYVISSGADSTAGDAGPPHRRAPRPRSDSRSARTLTDEECSRYHVDPCPGSSGET